MSDPIFLLDYVGKLYEIESL